MTDYLSFHLNREFVDGYRDKEVPWGFVDAAGSPVSEIVFFRTYSRKKSDGSKETWVDVCERVIDGMFSLQKDHAKKNRLPWSDVKAQRSAEEAFDRMFNFKWTPPGRGLWMTGTELVHKHGNSAALMNPLHEDSKVLTRSGWRRLGDLEGQDVELLSSTFLYGRDNDSNNKTSKWVKGSVSMIEEQPSIEIVYNDTMGNEKSIIASRNHRWFTRRGTHNNWKRVEGGELRPGDMLPVVKPRKNFLPSHAGMQHGFFFGDGSRGSGEFLQFGSSAAVMARLFGDQVEYNSRYSRVGQCPLAWGHLPEGRYLEDQRYVYGFLSGYFAADGCVGKDGSCSISSARIEELRVVRDLFMDLGIQVAEPRLSSTSSNFSEDRELWTIRIDRWDLQEEFFLKLDHKERWLASTFGKERTKVHARIKEIRDAGVQRVLCATVPHYEQFVTENFVLTSNCGFISTSDMTKQNPGEVFAWLMESSMLGIGIGFDTEGASKDLEIHVPRDAGSDDIVIPDTREGWVESVRILINTHLKPGQSSVSFDYSQIRPAGEPIKTFGGTAAGPEPLMRLHDKLRTLFAENEDKTLTSLLIMDIANLIGVCVVSGNVRRSAEVALGSLNDDDFVNAKNPEKFPYRSEWGWMSNNSVKANVGDDLSGITDAIALNGEPGIMWMDTTRNYGRLIDPPDYRDWRVQGYNPCCLTGDTMIQTTDGPRRIDSLTDTPSWAVLNGKAYRTTASWSNGVREVYTLRTKQGYEIRLTDDHRIQKSDGSWAEARDLTPGDEINLSNQRGVNHWTGSGTEGDGYLLGLLKGDGYVNGSGIPVVQVWEKDPGSDGVRDAALSAAENQSHRSDWSGWRDHGRGYLVMTVNKSVVDSYGMLNRSKEMTSRLDETSSEFHKGFLRGLFDADGHIEGHADGDDYKGASVRLSQSNRDELVRVQRMLLRFGIKSRIYPGQKERDQLMPDGKGGVKEYHCKASHRLVVSSDDVPVFHELIGFNNTDKSEKLSKIVATRRFYTKPFTATVSDIIPQGREEVFDITVSDVHAMDANGVVAHNCEQPLESFELCNLAEVYLNRHESKEDFLRTLKFVYMYAKTITLVPTHWERTNAIMQRNRRIGTSVSGIANFVDNNGLPSLREWLDEGYKTVRDYDRKYSEWLCIRESIRVTTVKPSGTVSLLAGESPGVHWSPGGEYHNRGIVFQKDDPMVTLFRDAGYEIQESAYTPETSVFVQFPIKSKAKRSEKDVSIFEKIDLAVNAQRYWSDNAVSVTVSFDAKDEAKFVPTVLQMHEGSLKTVSFLPQGNDTYPQMPYQEIDESEYQEVRDNLLKVDLSSVYGNGLDAEGEKFCSTEACEIPKG